MSSREFVRHARQYALKTGQECRFDPRRGKGSHSTLYLGTHFTVVKQGELSRGMLTAMLKDLGIARKDF